MAITWFAIQLLTKHFIYSSGFQDFINHFKLCYEKNWCFQHWKNGNTGRKLALFSPECGPTALHGRAALMAHFQYWKNSDKRGKIAFFIDTAVVRTFFTRVLFNSHNIFWYNDHFTFKKESLESLFYKSESHHLIPITGNRFPFGFDKSGPFLRDL